jgi:hypothetical protein
MRQHMSRRRGHRILRAVAAGVVMVAAAAAGAPVMGSPWAGFGPRVSLAASVAAGQPATPVTVPLVTGDNVTFWLPL